MCSRKTILAQRKAGVEAARVKGGGRGEEAYTLVSAGNAESLTSWRGGTGNGEEIAPGWHPEGPALLLLCDLKAASTT